MKNNSIAYGFKVSHKGYSFTRWKDNSEDIVSTDKSPSIPNSLHYTNIAQRYMSFKDAFYHCLETSENAKYKFEVFTKEEYNKMKNPYPKLRKLLKKIGIKL